MHLFPRFVIILVCAPLWADFTIDGRLDEPQWEEARVFEQFTTTQPLTLAEPQYKTSVKMLAREEGLYFGFVNEHPPSLSRTRPKKARDLPLEADRNSVMIDFQNKGTSAYEFTVSLANSIQDGVIVEQKKFSYDWDGSWQHAVSETDDQWFTEIFIPWTAVPMGKANDDTREISIYFTRVVHGLGIRYAFPEATWERPTFVSEFHRVEVPNYQSSVLDIFPYVTSSHDALANDEDYNGGVDLFWKPNGNHQFALTLNPDFGQVEADDLVVNFSAIEVFFSEKRPFFNENQALFAMDTTNGGTLVHTRRIGDAADDGLGGASDIIAAAKYTGASGPWDFGFFGAAEDDTRDARGRDFYAGRLRYNSDRYVVGLLNTFTDRPTLDRDARVTAMDYELKLKKGLLVRGQAIDTQVNQGDEDQTGFGTWIRGDWQPSDRFEYRTQYSYYDDEYNINDMGFMQRNDFEEGILGFSWRERQFKNKSSFQEADFHFDAYLRRNTSGDDLPFVYEMQYIVTYKDTSQVVYALEYEAEGTDDLVTRGGNDVIFPGQMKYFISYDSPPVGVFRFYSYLFVEPENLDGYAWEVAPRVAFFLSDNLNLSLSTSYRDGDEWLIWLAGNRLGTFRHETVETNFRLNWFPTKSQELRLRFQWVGIDGLGREGFLAQVDGSLMPDGLPVEDFILSFSGIQLRYRYKLGPLTDIFAVYSRGTDLFEEGRTLGLGSLFSEGWSQITADQFLVKARYRF